MSKYQNDEQYPTSFLDPSVESSHLFEKARQLGEVIERLSKERAALLNKGNQLVASTNVFPDEILSTIFQHAYPPIDMSQRTFGIPEVSTPRMDTLMTATGEEYLPHMVLGAVSHRWRRVAWSTPQLWTSLTLRVLNWNVVGCAHTMKLFFENVGDLPFSLELDFCLRSTHRNEGLGNRAGLSNPKSWSPLESIRDILFFDYPEKLKFLHLIAAPAPWLALLSTRFTHLIDLSLSDTTMTGRRLEIDPLFLGGIPHLRRLKLHDFHYPHSSDMLEHSYFPSSSKILPIELDWSKITDLVVGGIHHSTSVRLLHLCSNLRSFRLSSARGSEDIVESHAFSSHLYLEYFQWTPSPYSTSSCDDEQLTGLSQFLEFPSLRTLFLSGVSNPEDAHGNGLTQEKFFSRLPTTLVYLSLSRIRHSGGASATARYLSSCLQHIPSLEYLSMDSLCLTSVGLIFSLLHPSQDATIMMLPNLHSLELKEVFLSGCYESTTAECTFNPGIVKEVLRERNADGSEFSITMQGRCAAECLLTLRPPWLVELMETGFDLKSASERVDSDPSFGSEWVDWILSSSW